jgi:hypothetical protein
MRQQTTVLLILVALSRVPVTITFCPPPGVGKGVPGLEIRNEPLPLAEKHLSPAELAEAWGLPRETIRNIFREEPGRSEIWKSRPKRSPNDAT